MGDLLLELGKALAADNNDSNARETLEKIFIEGNNSVIISIEDLLTKTTDTKLMKKGSWLTRMSVLGPDGLDAIYKQAYPGKSKSYRKNMMEKDLGEDTKEIFTELEKFRGIIREAESSELAKAADDEAAVKQMVDEAVDSDAEEVPLDSDVDTLMEALYQEADEATDAMDLNTQLIQLVVTDLLKGTSYGGKTMYDFFMDENLVKSDLYTMAYVLSDGQKSIIYDLGLYPIFESILSEYAEENDEVEEDEDRYLHEGLISVYEGVDRSVFDGNAAITGDTLKSMETKQVNDVLGTDRPNHLMIAVVAALVGVFCTGMAIRAFTNETVMARVPLTKTVQKNIFDLDPATRAVYKKFYAMKNINKAWQLHYIEHKYPGYVSEEGKLGSITKRPLNDARAGELIADSYDDALKKLRAEGKVDVANKIEAFGAEKRTQHINTYEKKLNRMMTTHENYVKESKIKVPRGSWGSRIFYTLGAIAAFAFAGYEIYCMTKKSAPVQFTNIPEKMVYRTYEGDISYITYHVAGDASGVPVDLHDKKGQQWLAIYTTTSSKVGDPILASSLYVREDTAVSDPDEKAFSFFDEKYPSNIADKTLTGKDLKGAYIYYKTGTEEPEEVADTSEETEVSTEETKETATPAAVGTEATSEEEAPEESSVFAWPGMLWILLIILVIAGGAAGAGVYYRKRKK